MDPQSKRSERSVTSSRAKSVDPFLLAAAIAVIVHLLYFLVIDCWWTLEHFGPHVGIFIATRGIRLYQAPVAALAGIAVYGAWQILRFLGTKVRGSRLAA
jgi:hypothetical protein